MNPSRIPGNEPDSNDMSVDPAVDGGDQLPIDPGLAAEEDEAAKLGDFA
jgi:hypothetical protein